MKRIYSGFVSLLLALLPILAQAQIKPVDPSEPQTPVKVVDKTGETEDVLVLTLQDAIKIALSENVSVKVADMEVERAQYAKKGSYAALFPQIDGSASYQRTIKKQVMYMDFDMGSLTGMSAGGEDQTAEALASESSTGRTPGGGIEVGRWNTFMAGVSASLPLVNAQLWQSLKIAGEDVELAVEKARSSRLGMVTEVKQAYYRVLLAKEAAKVYKEVYENAVESFRQTERRFNVQKASELEYNRAKATVQNAIPQVYDSQNAMYLSLWQLKAVLGLDLEKEVDVVGALSDFSAQMFRDVHSFDGAGLEGNSTMRQLSIQARELADNIRAQKYAFLPTLSLGFSYSLNAMANDYKFSEYNWSPYSYVGVSLAIPIFAGGRRYYATRQAQNSYAQLELQKADTERQLRIAVNQYLSQMDTKMKTWQAACTAEETARKAYDIAAKSYAIGKNTITELNSAQLSLMEAQLSVSQAVYDFVVAKASLEQTLGCDFIEQ